jgi:hypothetical protein
MADSALVAGMIGSFIGGVLGVVGTVVTSYYGPRKLESSRTSRSISRSRGASGSVP